MSRSLHHGIPRTRRRTPSPTRIAHHNRRLYKGLRTVVNRQAASIAANVMVVAARTRWEGSGGFTASTPRWYDPETGRFLSRARFAPDKEHPYIYCESDPVGRTDPSGEFTTEGCDGFLKNCPTKDSPGGPGSDKCKDAVNKTNGNGRPISEKEKQGARNFCEGTEPCKIRCIKDSNPASSGIMGRLEATGTITLCIDYIKGNGNMPWATVAHELLHKCGYPQGSL